MRHEVPRCPSGKNGVWMATMKLKAVILAAGEGTRLRPLTDELPKCLVPVAGEPLLSRMMEPLADVGVEEVVVVTGFLAEKVESFVKAAAPLPARTVYNPRYNTANNFYSLLVAREALGAWPYLKLDGDVIFEPEVMRRVVEGEGGLRLGVDLREELGAEEMKVRLNPDEGFHRVAELSKQIDPTEAHGESMGIELITAASNPLVFQELEQIDKEGLHDEYYEFAYNRLAQKGHDVRAIDISGLRSTEIDDMDDLKRAEALFKS